MSQVKYRFDRETLVKIGKGALIAAAGGAALAVLDFIGTLEINNVVLASFIAWGIPVAVNVVKEWKKGK